MKPRGSDFKNAREAMKVWNEKYPEGTKVIVQLRDGGTMESVTKSGAFSTYAVPMVWVEGFKSPVPLKGLMPEENV